MGRRVRDGSTHRVCLVQTVAMLRGELRVYLGSAPGVGKTFHMLDEGWRRRARGTDVVVGFVEAHGRPSTMEKIRDLEVIPRISREYRGAQLEEMNLEAILARRPEVALVDELAHTNVPGSTHQKRWQDVETLLDAGINVITTVNIQHLESVSDVVEKITGITQRETIPDVVVRRAEQIELVDITPEALRRRMAHGNIYAADKVDASLSNYFRPGNLTALRELALLWLADRVEDSLQHYLADHGISDAWETRERLIVAVTGAATDEALLRRAARIASRTGAELVAVHVVNSSGLLDNADTSAARVLVGELDGVFQEIVDEDVARALVAFARSERGTQIVLGASRPRSTIHLTRGIVEKVLRQARDLDVHIIAVGGQRPAKVRRRRQKSSFSWTRTVVALVLTVLIMPLVTVAMTEIRSSLSLSTAFLVYLLVVLALTTWGGALVGIVAALVASGLENYYFVLPLHTLEVARPDDVVAIVAFLLFAIGASIVVSQFAQRSKEAERARSEAQVLARAAATVTTSSDDLLPLLESLRTIFAIPGVALWVRRDGEWAVELKSGEPVDESKANSRFVIDDDHTLVLAGEALDNQDRQLITVFLERVSDGLRSQSLLHDEQQQRALAQADALRNGLLHALSHELSTPLASIEAGVTSLLKPDVTRTPSARRGILVGLERDVRRLTRLVANLVDLRRLEAGLVTATVDDVDLKEVLDHLLDSVEFDGQSFDVDVPDDLPLLMTDRALLKRVIVNVVGNAVRFSPPGEPVRISACQTGRFVQLLVIDRGPGIAKEQRATLIAAQGQLYDEPSIAGIALTASAGFLKPLGGQLRFEDTPGGGLTVSIELLQDMTASPV
jgi:two-component system sensor histidine kinase KdpD